MTDLALFVFRAITIARYMQSSMAEERIRKDSIIMKEMKESECLYIHFLAFLHVVWFLINDKRNAKRFGQTYFSIFQRMY